eukprot:766803-Hanusia_phi.AAC.4
MARAVEANERRRQGRERESMAESMESAGEEKFIRKQVFCAVQVKSEKGDRRASSARLTAGEIWRNKTTCDWISHMTAAVEGQVKKTGRDELSNDA